jgi:hypothetical protein
LDILVGMLRRRLLIFPCWTAIPQGDSESDFSAVFGALSMTITSPIAFAEATKFVGSKNKDEKDTGEAIAQLMREIFSESDQPAEATNMKYIARIAIHGTLFLET